MVTAGSGMATRSAATAYRRRLASRGRVRPAVAAARGASTRGARPRGSRRGPTPARKKGGRPPKNVTANSAPPAKKLRSNTPPVLERPLPIEGRASKLPAERGPGDGVGKGAVLRVFFEGFGWATGHVQKVTRDGAVDVFWVSDASYSTITRSVAAAHVVPVSYTHLTLPTILLV